MYSITWGKFRKRHVKRIFPSRLQKPAATDPDRNVLKYQMMDNHRTGKPSQKRSSAPKSNASPFGYGTTWHYSCPPDKVLMCYTPTSKKTYRFFFFHPPPRLNFPNLHILFGCATSKRTQKEMKRGHKEANRSLSSVFKRLSLPSASVKKYRRWSNKKHVMKTKPSCPFLAQQCQTPPIFSSSFFSSLASWGLNVGLLSPPFFEPFDLIDDHWFNCQRKSCQGEIRNGRRNSTGW